VEKDLSNFEAFSSPNDNYHVTCLYIGGKVEKLNKRQEAIFRNWKDGQKQPILVDFIAYIPNRIMTGFSLEVG
jgi:hypothetical protein